MSIINLPTASLRHDSPSIDVLDLGIGPRLGCYLRGTNLRLPTATGATWWHEELRARAGQMDCQTWTRWRMVAVVRGVDVMLRMLNVELLMLNWWCFDGYRFYIILSDFSGGVKHWCQFIDGDDCCSLIGPEKLFMSIHGRKAEPILGVNRMYPTMRCSGWLASNLLLVDFNSWNFELIGWHGFYCNPGVCRGNSPGDRRTMNNSPWQLGGGRGLTE